MKKEHIFVMFQGVVKLMDTNKQMTKEDAIKLMLDGYKLVQTSELSKKQYRGMFYTYSQKFIMVDATSTASFDTNQMVSKWWSLAEIVPRMVPKMLFKTNLKIGKVITLEYTKILSKGTDKYRDMWAVVEFKGDDGKSHTIKMFYKQARGSYQKPVLKDYHMHFEQINIEWTKRTANFVLKCFVEEETEKQRKRHSTKKELETMETVRAIISNYPEVLV